MGVEGCEVDERKLPRDDQEYLCRGWLDKHSASLHLLLGLVNLDVIREGLVGLDGSSLLMPALKPVKPWKTYSKFSFHVVGKHNGHLDTQHTLPQHNVTYSLRSDLRP